MCDACRRYLKTALDWSQADDALLCELPPDTRRFVWRWVFRSLTITVADQLRFVELPQEVRHVVLALSWRWRNGEVWAHAYDHLYYH